MKNLAKVVRELSPHYGDDCPVAVCYRVGWPDQEIIRGTLLTIRAKVKASGFTRTALIMVGKVLDPIADQIIDEDESFSLDLMASDVDEDALYFGAPVIEPPGLQASSRSTLVLSSRKEPLITDVK